MYVLACHQFFQTQLEGRSNVQFFNAFKIFIPNRNHFLSFSWHKFAVASFVSRLAETERQKKFNDSIVKIHCKTCAPIRPTSSSMFGPVKLTQQGSQMFMLYFHTGCRVGSGRSRCPKCKCIAPVTIETKLNYAIDERV